MSNRLVLPGDQDGMDEQPKFVKIQPKASYNPKEFEKQVNPRPLKREKKPTNKMDPEERKLILTINRHGNRWRGMIKETLLPKINNLVDNLPDKALYGIYRAPWNDLPVFQSTELLTEAILDPDKAIKIVNQMLSPAYTAQGGVLPTDGNVAQSTDTSMAHMEGGRPSASNKVPFSQVTGSNVRGPVRSVMTLDKTGLHLHPGQPESVVREQLIRDYDNVSGSPYGPYYSQNRGQAKLTGAKDAIVMLNHD